MAFEGDARRVQQLLRSAASEVQSKKRQVETHMGQRGQLWKGKASDAFSSEFEDIRRDADRVIQCMDRASGLLGRLPSLIQRAEQERRRKAMESEKSKA